MNTSLDKEHPVPPTGIDKVIQRFNRNTTRVAMGLLAAAIFAALMVAFQERHLKADDFKEEPRQTSVDILPNTNPATLSDVGPLSEQSIGEIASRQARKVDCGLTPAMSPLAVDSNATSPSATPQPDSARVVRSKISNVKHRTSVRPRVVNVKMRLIALWHQSLARNFEKNFARGH
jgi:hypothetical protein